MLRASKRGQNWTIDYTIGLVIFIAAIVISIGIITNSYANNDFTLVEQEAARLADALMSPGYPSDWDGSDVIRPGILHEDRLSWRKLDLLTVYTPEQLRTFFATPYDFAFHIEDADGNLLAVRETCSFGSTVPAEMGNRTQDWKLAYYSRTGGSTELQSFASLHGADEYEDGEIELLLDNAHRYGVIILESPNMTDLVAATLNGSLTDDTLRQEFADAADLGPTFILTGPLGVPVLGANTTPNGSMESVVQTNNESFFLLNDSAVINTTAEYELFFLPAEETLLGNLDGAAHTETLLLGGGHTTAARWVHGDARVYWFADTQGVYDEGDGTLNLQGVLENGIENLLRRSSRNCTLTPESIQAEQVVKTVRLVADRGEIRKLVLYVWGDS